VLINPRQENAILVLRGDILKAAFLERVRKVLSTGGYYIENNGENLFDHLFQVKSHGKSRNFVAG